jgi:hypothetical protein
MKTVTVFNTRGQQRTEVRTDANTWGDLQIALNGEGVEFMGMRATIGETQVSLASNAAQLPDFDFTLFLSPKRAKAGINL